MELIIDTNKIKDLLENEWGYKGIRDDLDNLFLKNGIPLDKMRDRIACEKLGYPPSADEYKTINKILQIIDKYRGDAE